MYPVENRAKEKVRLFVNGFLEEASEDFCTLKYYGLSVVSVGS